MSLPKTYSRAPLRISFGGGGSEIPPYVDEFGGVVFSSTISMFATTCLTVGEHDNRLAVHSQESLVSHYVTEDIKDFSEILGLPKENQLGISCAWYIENIMKVNLPRNISIWTSSDAPQGSGLGTSSVMSVSILKAFDQLLKLNFSQNHLARTAFEIERQILKLSGGLQDHYAAAYGGLNFIKFDKNRTASVMPLNLNPNQRAQLESSLLLIYTGTSRESGSIIELQQESMRLNNSPIIQELHTQKVLAEQMFRAVTNGSMERLGKLMDESWNIKKNLAPSISNSSIDALYSRSLELGAFGGKISGAGGGGFLLLVVPPNQKYSIFNQLKNLDVIQFPISLEQTGAISWQVP